VGYIYPYCRLACSIRVNRSSPLWSSIYIGLKTLGDCPVVLGLTDLVLGCHLFSADVNPTHIGDWPVALGLTDLVLGCHLFTADYKPTHIGDWPVVLGLTDLVLGGHLFTAD
jgi:hypothetical protein